MKKRSLHYRSCRTAVSILLTCLLLFALLPTAFAAQEPAVSLESKLDHGQLIVRLYFDNAIGLKDCDLDILYDPDVLAFSYNDIGTDAGMVRMTESNTFTYDLNADSNGLLMWSCVFKTELTDAETFANDVVKPGTVHINDEHFEAQIFYFDVKDAAASQTTIRVKPISSRCVNAYMSVRSYKTQISLNPDADRPTARLEQISSEENALVFGLYLDDAIGLEAWNLQIDYDPAVLEFSSDTLGEDAAAAANLQENYLTSEIYEKETGRLRTGGYFVTALGADAQSGEAAD